MLGFNHYQVSKVIQALGESIQMVIQLSHMVAQSDNYYTNNFTHTLTYTTEGF